MILMSQIFDITANENAWYKRNELEYFMQAGRRGRDGTKAGADLGTDSDG